MALGSTIISGAGGSGYLGTLFVRLTADNTHLVRIMAQSERAMGAITGPSNSATLAVVGLTASMALFAREAIRFEHSFANVKKVMEGTDEEVQKLSEDLRKLALVVPVNVNELNSLAETGARMGIEGKNLLTFTKSVAALASTTELTAEAGGTLMAKFANQMGMAHDQYDRLASTLAALDVASVAKAGEIMELAERMASAGQVMRMTAPEIMGMASALASLGVRAEMGGTAVSQLMRRVHQAAKTGGEELKFFAATAGMSIEEFARLVEDKAAVAMTRFFVGVGQLVNRGADVFTIFDQMGIDARRMTDVLLRLGLAQGLFIKQVTIGISAYEKNNEHLRIAEEIWGTTLSQLKLTGAEFRDMAIEIGSQMIPSIREMNELFRDFAGWLKESDSASTGFITAVQTMVGLFKLLAVGAATVYTILQSLSTLIAGMAVSMFGKFNQEIKMGVDMLENYRKRLPELFAAFRTGNSEAFSKVLEQVTLEGGVKAVAGALKAGPDSVAQAHKDAAEVMKSSIADVEAQWQGLATLIDRIFPSDQSVFDRIFKPNPRVDVVGNLKEIGSALKQTFDVMKDNLAGKLFSGGSFLDQVGQVNAQDISKQVAAIEAAQKVIDEMKGPAFPQQFEDPLMRDAMDLVASERDSNDALNKIREFQQKELALGQEHMTKMEALQKAHSENLKNLMIARAQFTLAVGAHTFDSLAEITKAWAGEQSGIFKAMFAASKAFAVATATVNIFKAISDGWAQGASIWEKIAAVGIIASQTASIVSNIQAVQLEFGGERRFGGSVSSSKAYMVGENGPEMFSPASAGTIIPNDAMGGATTINVHNYAGDQVDVRERDTENGKMIDILIRRVKKEIGSDIRDGRGEVNSALQNSFVGLRRGTV